MNTSYLRAAMLLALASTPAVAQRSSTDRDAFTWSAVVPQGRWIRVQNLNGEITVGQASGDKVEVTATKRWRRGDPDVVRFDVQKFGAGDQSVLICALWGDTARCDQDGYHDRNNKRDPRLRNNDTNVEFRVLVPKGVRVGINTVNGALFVDGVTAEVDAHTVNGGVDVTTTGGPVNAQTVNGSVRARVGKLTSSDDMTFSTVNGSVVAEFSDEVNGDVELSTVNGGLRTDYEITISGRLDPKHLRAHIGKPGGPRIRLSTVNGGVELRKR